VTRIRIAIAGTVAALAATVLLLSGLLRAPSGGGTRVPDQAPPHGSHRLSDRFATRTESRERANQSRPSTSKEVGA